VSEISHPVNAFADTNICISWKLLEMTGLTHFIKVKWESPLWVCLRDTTWMDK